MAFFAWARSYQQQPPDTTRTRAIQRTVTLAPSSQRVARCTQRAYKKKTRRVRSDLHFFNDSFGASSSVFQRLFRTSLSSLSPSAAPVFRNNKRRSFFPFALWVEHHAGASSLPPPRPPKPSSCKRCLLGRRKPDALRPGVVRMRGSMVSILQ